MLDESGTNPKSAEVRVHRPERRDEPTRPVRCDPSVRANAGVRPPGGNYRREVFDRRISRTPDRVCKSNPAETQNGWRLDRVRLFGNRWLQSTDGFSLAERRSWKIQHPQTRRPSIYKEHICRSRIFGNSPQLFP